MKFGVRGKLFLISIGLLVLVGIFIGILLDSQVHSLLLRKSEADLLRHTSVIKVALEMSDTAVGDANLDSLVRKMARISGARVSVVADGGHLLADSHLGTAQLHDQGNQARFDEIEEARLRGRGISQRHSIVLGTDALFAAMPAQLSAGNVMVRTALPLTGIADTLHQVRVLLWGAGLIGLLLAALMTGVASHILSRTFREVVDKAQALLSRRLSRQIDSYRGDEIGVLAFSLDRLADETERLVSELAAERDRIAAILDGMKEGVLAVDRRGRVLLMNQAAQALLSPRQTEPGLEVEECIRLPRIVELTREALAGQTHSEEVEVAGSPQRVLMVQTAVPRTGAGAIAVFWDVTALRQLERVRRDFVANVSHELRTPVSVVRANAELLLDGGIPPSDPSRGLVEAILRNALRMGRLVEDLLTLARIEAGKYQLSLSPVRLDVAVATALETTLVGAEARRVQLIAEIPEGLCVMSDARALDHVLVNLLDNAAKYGRQGGSVVVRARQSSGEVRIEVVDDGPGIAPQHRPRVFERFYRVDPGRARDTGGTGLGLSIVRHLVESMNGKVGVEPAEPRGSIFWFSLPTAEVAQENLACDPLAARIGPNSDQTARS